MFNLKPSALALSIGLAMSVGLTPQTSAASYTFTDLGTLGGTISYASAINNSGQVAGMAYTAGNTDSRAMVWQGTTATVLGTLGGNYSGGNAINNSGQVVGWSYTPGNNYYYATLWNGTNATALLSKYPTESVANAINDSGQVVGMNGGGHATLWNGTTGTELETWNSSEAQASTMLGKLSVLQVLLAGFPLRPLFGAAPRKPTWGR